MNEHESQAPTVNSFSFFLVIFRVSRLTKIYS